MIETGFLSEFQFFSDIFAFGPKPIGPSPPRRWWTVPVLTAIKSVLYWTRPRKEGDGSLANRSLSSHSPCRRRNYWKGNLYVLESALVINSVQPQNLNVTRCDHLWPVTMSYGGEGLEDWNRLEEISTSRAKRHGSSHSDFTFISAEGRQKASKYYKTGASM